MQAVGLLRDLGYTNVGHYAGGLTEWFEAERREGSQLQSSTTAAPAAGRVRARRDITARFVDALADRSVRDLLALWIAVVLVWAAAYWLMAMLPGGALQSNGRMLPLDARGAVSAVYF